MILLFVVHELLLLVLLNINYEDDNLKKYLIGCDIIYYNIKIYHKYEFIGIKFYLKKELLLSRKVEIWEE